MIKSAHSSQLPVTDTGKEPPIETRVLFGGSFDPIHNGHILSAKHVMQWLGMNKLDVNKLTFIPAHISPHKQSTSASAQQRTNMVKLVCAENPNFTCDEREIKRATHNKNPSYTVESLREIKQENPHSRLFFIMGMDALLSFTQWHQWQEILSLTHLVINTRPNYPLTNLSEDTSNLLAQYKVDNITELANTTAGHILFAPSIEYPISSTDIREKIKANQNCEKLLPETVLAYIQQHRLYTASALTN